MTTEKNHSIQDPTQEIIIEMALKLQYIKPSVKGKVNVLIDRKEIEVSRDNFVKSVHSNLATGKTLVSAIRDTAFTKARTKL
jgi:hypothetical protein